MRYVKILLLIAAIGAATGFYLYNKPVKSTSSRSVELTVKSDELFNEFSGDENIANGKYLDLVVAVNGTVTNIEQEDGMQVITLNTASDMFGVICKMEVSENDKTVKTGDVITVKGICTGMLMDVVMVRCVIVNS